MEIRPATLDDAESIREIYNRWVASSTFTFDMVPRSLEEQRSWLTQRSGAHAVLVAVEDGRVAGFSSLSPYRDRPAYATTVETSIWLGEGFRGRGIGRSLLEALVDTARNHGFHTALARITGTNEPSIGLHRAVGYEIVGTEKEVGRKFGSWLDVVVLQLMLGTSSADPAS